MVYYVVRGQVIYFTSAMGWVACIQLGIFAFQVMETEQYLYLVTEYASKGEIFGE